MANVSKFMLRIITIIGIFSLFIVGYKLFSARRERITPHEELPLAATPPNGQTGGIEDIYYHENFKNCNLSSPGCAVSYVLVRFYPNGDVVTAGVGLSAELRGEDLPWLESLLRTDNEQIVAQGQYYISGEKIWFSVGDGVNTSFEHYYGIIVRDHIVLDRMSLSSSGAVIGNLDNAVFRKFSNENEN